MRCAALQDYSKFYEKELQFRCSCSRCRAGPTIDQALEQIRHREEILEDWSVDSPATSDYALGLIRQYNIERLEAFLDVPYGYAALEYNAVGDWAQARRYAIKAADVMFSGGLAGFPSYKEWKELANNPRIHWSWLARLRR